MKMSRIMGLGLMVLIPLSGCVANKSTVAAEAILRVDGCDEKSLNIFADILRQHFTEGELDELAMVFSDPIVRENYVKFLKMGNADSYNALQSRIKALSNTQLLSRLGSEEFLRDLNDSFEPILMEIDQ